jgi:hypothetical protein
MLLHGSGNRGALLAWIGRILVYLALAAGSAALVGWFRRGREAGKSECEYRHDTFMRGDWDWNIVPEDKAEWIIFSVALLIVLGAALWIFR